MLVDSVRSAGDAATRVSPLSCVAGRWGAMASTTGERIYRARKTVLQMLRDRGYMVDETDVEQGEEDFFEKYTTSPQRDMLTLLVQVRVRSES